MSEENGVFEWELCKENVLPLRSGRDCSTLNAVLQPHTGDQQIKVKAEKHDFELELRTYCGEDPLDVWDRYIKWIEKTFPSRGVGGKFIDLLQRCLKQFNDDVRYTNDSRYIHWWIQFANLCDDPLEIFNYMFDKGLGTHLSRLYESWAWSLEQVGNLRKADAIFREGYTRIKEPPAQLEVKYQEFQFRAARVNVSQESYIECDEQEGRAVLGQLKGQGRNQHVGTSRVGNAKQASRGGLGLRVQPLKTQNQGFEVFNEENNQPNLAPTQTGEWTSLPTRKQANRENALQPGAWNKATLPQRTGYIGSIGQQSFKVHVETNDLMTPCKALCVDDHVLSARKPNKSTADPLDAIRNTKPGNMDQLPAYDKSKIYTGTEEFSFEELRAAKYIKEKKERQKIEEEKRQIEAEKQELIRMRQELNQYHATIRENIHLEGQVIMQEIQSKLHNSTTEIIPIAEQIPKPIPRFSVIPNKCIPSNENRLTITPGSLENSRELNVTKQLNFDEMTTGLSENRSILISSHNNSQQTPNLSTNSASTFSAGSRQRSGMPTPDSDSLYRKHGLTAPSPTVHTKEALQVVMGMFNSSLHSDTHFGWSETTEKMEGIECIAVASNAEAPFTIYDETNRKKEPPIPPPSIPVYVDKENIVCQVSLETKPKTKRGLCEMTQPSEVTVPDRLLPKPVIPEDHIQNGLNYEEKMDDLEDDFTMASVGFSATARLASTPYNLSTDVNFLFAPPLSTIKYSERSNLTLENMQPSEVCENSTNNTSKPLFPSQEKTFDIHMDTPNKVKLSPIMEGSTEGGSSDESKSQASSLALKNNSQHHTLYSSHITSRNTTHSLASINENQHTEQKANLHFSINDFEMESVPSFSASQHSTTKKNCFQKSTNQVVDQPILHLENLCINSENGVEQAEIQRLGSVDEDAFPVPPASMEDATDQHVIDISCYIPPDMDEKTEALLLTSVIINPKNPFETKIIEDILNNLTVPLKNDPDYRDCNFVPIPEMRANNFVDLGGEMYQIVSCIGEGGFAKIFKAIFINNDFLDCDEMTGECSDVVLKVQKPACYWEFYICKEIQKRLKQLQEAMDVSPSILTINKGYFFDNGSCLLQDYFSGGTLLNLVNSIKRSKKLMAELEPFVVYVTIEILHIIDKLHKCQIIHGDIKPDNFLVRTIPDIHPSNSKLEVFGKRTKFLKLIDFGQSIDMNKFEKGTVFVAKVKTDGFRCIEMQTDQPWTYQTDLFGMIGTIHVLIFGKYMKVYQSRGQWHFSGSFVRKWNQGLWKGLFDTLLNIPSCDQLPDLTKLRLQFEDYFMSDVIHRYNHVANLVLTETLLKK